MNGVWVCMCSLWGWGGVGVIDQMVCGCAFGTCRHRDGRRTRLAFWGWVSGGGVTDKMLCGCAFGTCRHRDGL